MPGNIAPFMFRLANVDVKNTNAHSFGESQSQFVSGITFYPTVIMIDNLDKSGVTVHPTVEVKIFGGASTILAGKTLSGTTQTTFVYLPDVPYLPVNPVAETLQVTATTAATATTYNIDVTVIGFLLDPTG